MWARPRHTLPGVGGHRYIRVTVRSPPELQQGLCKTSGSPRSPEGKGRADASWTGLGPGRGWQASSLPRPAPAWATFL